jgi:hypothetical protein
MNTKKKEIKKKKEMIKRRATSVRRPLSLHIYVKKQCRHINRAYVFFWVLVWPCQLFVRLWYRVSDALDLSLVSKRFGFWPHITHVIVLTFKEKKHLSDYRTVMYDVDWFIESDETHGSEEPFTHFIGGRRSGDCMVVGFTTTCTINTYHH